MLLIQYHIFLYYFGNFSYPSVKILHKELYLYEKYSL